jgi:hypothetical protein
MLPDLDKILERVSRVKLTGGLVGRVCTVALVYSVVIGVLGALSRNEWVMGGAVVAILVIVFPMLWRVINFAEKNPQVAILDGAQFLKHEQLVLASKGVPEITVIPEAQIQEQPALPSPAQVASANKPDEQPALSGPGGQDESR